MKATKASVLSSLFAIIAMITVLCQCTAYLPPADYSRTANSSSVAERESTTIKQRPGLGTTWGEARTSHVTGTDFKRKSSRPDATVAIRYNDKDGLPSPRWSVRQPFLHGGVSIGIKSNGRYLKAYNSSSDTVVVGEHGERYSIYLRNQTDRRVEVVLSVDGLDVLDGKSASHRKRGYVIGPRGRLSVDGFRRSYESVAAFRFGSVDSSYATRSTGSSRNVGVIGMAVFHEKPDHDWHVRKDADPFPGERGSGQFAQPPR